MTTKKRHLNHSRFLSVAAHIAELGTKKGWGGPFGAVIVRNGKIISAACNTVLKNQDPIRHAEMNALSKAARKFHRFDLSDCDIYSTTEPCPMCFSAIHWARIPKIYFSATITQVKKLGFKEMPIGNKVLKRLGKSKIRLIRLKNRDCARLLHFWKSLTFRKTY